jgi:hypothetical protein
MYALAAFGIEVDQNNPAGLAKFFVFYSLKNHSAVEKPQDKFSC